MNIKGRCQDNADGLHRAYTIDSNAKPDSALVRCSCGATEYMATWFFHTPAGWSRLRFRLLRRAVEAYLASTQIDIGNGQIGYGRPVRIKGQKKLYKIVERVKPSRRHGFDVVPIYASRHGQFSTFVDDPKRHKLTLVPAEKVFPVDVFWVVKDRGRYYTPYGQWVGHPCDECKPDRAVRQHAEEHDDYRIAWLRLDYLRKLGNKTAKIYRVTIFGDSMQVADRGRRKKAA